MNLKQHTRSLSVLLMTLFLSSCATKIPDIEVCAIGLSLENGASCVRSISDGSRELSGAQFVAYLEPSESKAPALCMSSSDFSKLKTAIEQLCHRLGQKCNKEQLAWITKLESTH